jgi:sugar phosphate isomerase/epimerase
MAIGRREFLAAAAVAGVSGVLRGAEPKDAGCPAPKKSADRAVAKLGCDRKAVLKMSGQEGFIPGASLSEKFDLMEKWGFEGVELSGRGLPGRVKEVQDAIKGRPIKVSAICAGFEGWLIAEDKEQRDLAMRTMKEVLTAAGELGSTGVIYVPAFNAQKSLPHKEARQLLTGFDRWDKRKEHETKPLLLELGEHADKCGTRTLLEPLNRDECYFVRTLADAASICRDVNHPGVALMGDFWHMTWEETSDAGAFITAGDYLHHVHMASRKRRRTPGEDGPADNYVDGFKGLKAIGYQDYVSFECGTVGDKMTAIPAALKLLREQWEQA